MCAYPYITLVSASRVCIKPHKLRQVYYSIPCWDHALSLYSCFLSSNRKSCNLSCLSLLISALSLDVTDSFCLFKLHKYFGDLVFCLKMLVWNLTLNGPAKWYKNISTASLPHLDTGYFTCTGWHSFLVTRVTHLEFP